MPIRSGEMLVGDITKRAVPLRFLPHGIGDIWLDGLSQSKNEVDDNMEEKLATEKALNTADDF